MAASTTRRHARDRLAVLRPPAPGADPEPSADRAPEPPDDQAARPDPAPWDTPPRPAPIIEGAPLQPRHGRSETPHDSGVDPEPVDRLAAAPGDRQPAVRAKWTWPVFDDDPVPVFDDGPIPAVDSPAGAAHRAWWPPELDVQPPPTRAPAGRHLSLVSGGAARDGAARDGAGGSGAVGAGMPVATVPDRGSGPSEWPPKADGASVGVADPAGRALRLLRGRLVRRWLPPGADRWRFDPGRRGALVLAAVVLLGAVVAGFAVWRARPVPEPAPALATVETTSSAGPAGAELVVSVGGAVARPGLVRLSPGARVADALAAAGGPLPGTDLSGVNLARRLTDGEHVVVGAPGPAGAPVAESGSRVDLNTATLAELDALPGVGPVTAQRILDWRAAHGRFAGVDQLREVDGIGEARFVRLRDLVTA